MKQLLLCLLLAGCRLDSDNVSVGGTVVPIDKPTPCDSPAVSGIVTIYRCVFDENELLTLVREHGYWVDDDCNPETRPIFVVDDTEFWVNTEEKLPSPERGGLRKK